MMKRYLMLFACALLLSGCANADGAVKAPANAANGGETEPPVNAETAGETEPPAARRIGLAGGVTAVSVTHTARDGEDEWTVTSEEGMSALREWLDGLEYEPGASREGESPEDFPGGESFTFQADGKTLFSYLKFGEDDAYLRADGSWYRVKDPADPVIIATGVSCSSEYPAPQAADRVRSGGEETEAGTAPAIEGVGMYVQSVADGILVLRLSNATDRTIQTGDSFRLYRRTADGYEPLEPVPEDYGFDGAAHEVKKDEPLELEVPYEWLYGKLPPGQYRIRRQIDELRGAGDFDSYAYDADFVVGDLSYGLYYGTSALYTREEMDAALLTILGSLQPEIESGCELHNIRYASDGCSDETNLARLNALAGADTAYRQCIEFSGDFRSSPAGTGALDADREYTGWNWWLARTDGGDWELVTSGY